VLDDKKAFRARTERIEDGIRAELTENPSLEDDELCETVAQRIDCPVTAARIILGVMRRRGLL
jgi:hypothetical protein